ncbi:MULTISPECIES: acyltransferase [Bradyrhizobium]|uniref:acyltransferase n=1 Tax=Bradyrhizobium TaxID=374 RepID=UPI0023EE6515|nr:acyltransferase [Bradyrhizobium zhengyangense]
MLHQRFGLRIDRVAPIVIHDDVYIGEGALILGGTTIGEGSIIGAGSVLRRKIPAGSVVVGNPAKVVARVEDLMRIWEAESQTLPWAPLIAERQGAYDAAIEPKLRELRQKFFFSER